MTLHHLPRGVSIGLGAALLLAGCSGALATAAPGNGEPPATSAPAQVTAPRGASSQAVPPAAAPTQTPVATAAPAPVGQGVLRFRLTPDQSKATFRVQEQLARLKLPSEAVGSTGKVTGQIVVTMDGSVVSDQSKVTVDMTDLRTDDQLRDGLIKRTTLETQRYGTAEFVPTAAHGLPSPIPESGEYTFQLTGPTTIHGVQKELTWDVMAKRQGSALNATASTQFHFGDFGMEPPRAPVVLAVTDNIRLEVQIVATQG